MLFEDLRSGRRLEAVDRVSAFKKFGLSNKRGRIFVLPVEDRIMLEGGV